MQCPASFPYNCSTAFNANPKWEDYKGPPCVPNADECVIPPGRKFGSKLKKRYPSRGSRRPYTKYCVPNGGGQTCLRARRAVRYRRRQRDGLVWMKIVPVIVPELVRTPEDAARIRRLGQRVEDLQRQLRSRPGDTRMQADLVEALRKLKDCKDANAVLTEEEKIHVHELRSRARQISDLEQQMRRLAEDVRARPDDIPLRNVLSDLEEHRDRLIRELTDATGNRRRLETRLVQMTHNRDELKLDLDQHRRKSERTTTAEINKYKDDLRECARQIASLERKASSCQQNMNEQANLLEQCNAAKRICAQKQAEFLADQAVLETKIHRADETIANLRQEINRLATGTQTVQQQRALQIANLALERCKAGNEQLKQAQVSVLEKKDAELKLLRDRIQDSANQQQATVADFEHKCIIEIERLQAEQQALERNLDQAGRMGITLNNQNIKMEEEMRDLRSDYTNAYNDLIKCQAQRTEAENALHGANIELQLCRQERSEDSAESKIPKDTQARVQEEKDKLERELSHIKADFGKAVSEINRLQTEISAFNDDVAAMDVDIKSLEAEAGELKRDKAISDKKIEELQRNRNDNGAIIVAAKQDVDSRLRKCQDELQAAQEIRDRASDAMNQAQDDRDVYKSQLDQLQSDWNEGRQQYSQLKQDRDTGKSEIQRLERDLHTLRDGLDRQIVALKIDVDEKQKAVDEMTQRLYQCDNDLQKGQTRIDKLAQDLAKINADLDRSEEERKEMQTRFDSAQAGLQKQLDQTLLQRDECRTALEKCQSSLRKRRAEPEAGPEGPPLRRRRVEVQPAPVVVEQDDDRKHDVSRCPSDYPINCATQGSRQAYWSKRSAACVPVATDCDNTLDVIKLMSPRKPWVKKCTGDGTGDVCP